MRGGREGRGGGGGGGGGGGYVRKWSSRVRIFHGRRDVQLVKQGGVQRVGRGDKIKQTKEVKVHGLETRYAWGSAKIAY